MIYTLFFTIFIIPFCLGRVMNNPPNQDLSRDKMYLPNKDASKRLLQPTLKIRHAPADFLEVTAGESKVLECEAGGSPPPAIYWTKDGKRLLQSAYPSPLSVDAQDSTLGLGFTRSRLFVNCASHEDAGIYSCVAENEYIRAFKDSQVFVDETLDANNEIICLDKKPFGIPARVHMWTHTRLEVMGKDAQLYCRSSGDPKPRVMWKGPDEEVITSSKKYKFLPNGDMIVRNIDWTDMGVYTCVATNSEGSDEAMVFLYPTMPENNIEM